MQALPSFQLLCSFPQQYFTGASATYPVQDDTPLVSLEVAHVCDLQAATLPKVPLPCIHHHHAIPSMGRHLLEGSLHLQGMRSMLACLTQVLLHSRQIGAELKTNNS